MASRSTDRPGRYNFRNQMGPLSSKDDDSDAKDLVSFYRGTGVDFSGRTLNDIMKFDMNKLESDHAFIQTLFPLPEESGAVGSFAPKLDEKVFKAFRKSPTLRKTLYNSFSRTLWFYGLQAKVDEEGKFVKIEKHPKQWSLSKKPWNNSSDHNHLRITRIIRCLRILGLEKEAQAFYEFLGENAVRASATSHKYWKRAAERPLNVRPDLDVNESKMTTVGEEFLKKFEKNKRDKEEIEWSQSEGET